MAEGAAVGALFEVPNVPLSVVLDSPVPDSLLTAPATIVLAATAEDVDGGIVQVEFLQGGTPLGVDTEPPYEVAWADVPAGVYALTARATDVRGRVTTSGPVAVTVETRFVATADTYVLSRSLTIRRNHGSDTRLRVRHAGARSTYWAVKKTAFMAWIDGELRADPRLAQDVDALVSEMKLEQELVALREMRGLSQRDLAERLGTSQPYVAKLESGRVKNFGVKTLVKCARALGASVTIKIEPHPRPVRRRARSRKHR